MTVNKSGARTNKNALRNKRIKETALAWINGIKEEMDDPSNRKKFNGTVNALVKEVTDHYGLHFQVITIVKKITNKRNKRYGKGERWVIQNPLWVEPEDRIEGWDIAARALHIVWAWEASNRARYTGKLSGVKCVGQEKTHHKVRLGLKLSAAERQMNADRLTERRQRIALGWGISVDAVKFDTDVVCAPWRLTNAS